MKIKLIFIFSIYSSLLYSQKYDGVLISGQIDKCISEYKKRGYKLDKVTAAGAILKGILDHKEIELYITKTPKTLQVAKITIYFPEQKTWSALKEEYKMYRYSLIEKYQSIGESFDIFDKPYYEGDGHELSALKIGKVHYSTFWMMESDNTNIHLSISEYAEVSISYENRKNMELLKSENEDIRRSKL